MNTRLTTLAPARFHRTYPVLSLVALLLWAALPAALPAQDQPYLPLGLLDPATLLAPPPLPGSAEQAADLAEVIAIHDSCASNEMAVAFSEKKFSVFNFKSAVGEFFDAETLPKNEVFFHRVQKEAAAVGGVLQKKRAAIVAAGRTLGWHRVCIGRHYPTDIYAGRVLAQAIVRELKSSPAFQKDLAEVKAEMAAAFAAVRKLK